MCVLLLPSLPKHTPNNIMPVTLTDIIIAAPRSKNHSTSHKPSTRPFGKEMTLGGRVGYINPSFVLFFLLPHHTSAGQIPKWDLSEFMSALLLLLFFDQETIYAQTHGSWSISQTVNSLGYVWLSLLQGYRIIFIFCTFWEGGAKRR
jgi:hypothetical protein